MTVGQDAMVEMVVGPRSPVDANGRWWPWDEEEEPARSMDAAAEVVGESRVVEVWVKPLMGVPTVGELERIAA